jgi:ParB family chromosome partitioning protein
MAARVVAEKLNVRDLEHLASGERLKKASAGKKGAGGSETKSADTRALEKRLEEALGLKVALTPRGGEKTVLTLEIDDYDQLDTVVDRLTRR